MDALYGFALGASLTLLGGILAVKHTQNFSYKIFALGEAIGLLVAIIVVMIIHVAKWTLLP